MSEKHHDVVIIGAGAGGGAAAWALCEAGVRVLLLEAGPAYDPLQDYPLDRPDWEKKMFPAKNETHEFYTFAPLQKLQREHDKLRSVNHITGLHNPGDTRKPFQYHHVRGVGGSTLHFTGEAHRMHPASMQMHTRFGVSADWPMSYAELEPFYQLAENIIGVAGPANDLSRPRTHAFPLPAHPFSFASRKIAQGMKKSGMTAVANARAALSRPYDDRPACNYCANCNRGCPRTDKGSVDVTFIRKALAGGNLTLLPNCEVVAISPGKDDRVASITVNNQSRHQQIKPKILILAAGAIQSPRLLLTASNSQAPEGLSNESGQVGKNFMETLLWVSSGLHPENLGSQRGLPADIISWSYNAPDAIPGITGGCRFGSSVSEANLLGLVNYATRVIPGWGLKHKQAMRRYYGNVISVSSIGEHPVNDQSFIDLHPREKDSNGVAKAVIHSWLTDQDIARLTFMADKCREIVTASGATSIFEEYGSYDFFSATHVFGTCRMGKDPKTSVVNAFGQSHRWKNLFVTDASVFPSSGGGESPSLTIEALAIRTGQHIARSLLKREI